MKEKRHMVCESVGGREEGRLGLGNSVKEREGT